MNSSRSPSRYREDAAHFRQLAAAITDSAELRDSYLALSIEYERLAQILDQSAPASATPESPDVTAADHRSSRRRARPARRR
jgi:hypothetical protein